MIILSWGYFKRSDFFCLIKLIIIVANPTRPININIININLPPPPNNGVTFKLNPTVANAETVSKNKFNGEIWGSINVKAKNDMIITIIAPNIVANARLTESEGISRLNKTTLFLPRITEIKLAIDVANVFTFIPPAVD